jgi:hypothetical protein
MKARQDLVTGAVFFAIAAGLLLEATGLPPGAALVPRAALGALMLLSVLLALRGLRALRAQAGPEDGAPFVQAPARLLVGVLAMAAYIAAIETVGFYPATAVFVPATAYALGARDRVAILLAGVGFLVFAYVVFDILFERVMPAGLLFSGLDPGAMGTGHA